jgi:hypothetical protein
MMEAHRLKGIAGAKARARKATIRDEYEHYCSQPQVTLSTHSSGGILLTVAIILTLLRWLSTSYQYQQ